MIAPGCTGSRIPCDASMVEGTAVREKILLKKDVPGPFSTGYKRREEMRGVREEVIIR